MPQATSEPLNLLAIPHACCRMPRSVMSWKMALAAATIPACAKAGSDSSCRESVKGGVAPGHRREQWGKGMPLWNRLAVSRNPIYRPTYALAHLPYTPAPAPA